MLTIFTPAYNRAYTLERLYKSLCNQTNFDFEWLIVDDGSTDNTKELVKTFSSDNFKIRYYLKENEGKHIAINYGAELAAGEWFFIVDSDDYLPENSVETVLNYCRQIENNPEFAGVAGIKAFNKDEIIGTTISEEYLDATTIEYRYKYKIVGDKAEVIRTDILKKYKFKKFLNEKFMQESVLWYATAEDGYKFRWFNEIIYYGEYIEDGLTRNGREIARKSCLSRSYADNHIVGIKEIPLKVRFKSCINYYRYGMYGNKNIRELFVASNSKLLSLFSIIVAVVLKIK